MVTGLEPHQVTDPLKIIIFNKHLFNREIKKSVAKGYHRNLKGAFYSAPVAERKAKKFECLTDGDPSVMAVTARQQVNQVAAAAKMEQSTVELNQLAIDGPHLLILHLTGKNFIIIVTSVEKEDPMHENAHNT